MLYSCAAEDPWRSKMNRLAARAGADDGNDDQKATKLVPMPGRSTVNANIAMLMLLR